MIEVYTGFVGSGKSFAATALGVQIADAPLGKKTVVANFPIKPKKRFLSFLRKNKVNNPRWVYKDNEELTVKFLVQESIKNGWNKKEGSALVIFDEASIPFNSRNWNSPDRMDWIKFLTQSRKFGYDFIFITQDSRLLDKQVRALCEYEVCHKKMNNMFALKWLSLFRITLFAGVSFWNGTAARSTKGQLRLTLYRKKIAERYDSLNLFDYQDAFSPSPTAAAKVEGAGTAGGSPTLVEAVKGKPV